MEIYCRHQYHRCDNTIQYTSGNQANYSHFNPNGLMHFREHFSKSKHTKSYFLFGPFKLIYPIHFDHQQCDTSRQHHLVAIFFKGRHRQNIENIENHQIMFHTSTQRSHQNYAGICAESKTDITVSISLTR